MISREEAYQLLKKYLKNPNLIKHSIAVEAILADMAKKLHKDEDLWRITGILHDLDYEYTKEEPEKHATISAQILEGLIPDKALNAIKAHNYMHTSQVPSSSLDKSLIAADAVSGLIIATALIIPSKKLQDVRIETLYGKFKDKSFAAGCNRKRIELCTDVGIELPSFLKLSLESLQTVANELDL